MLILPARALEERHWAAWQAFHQHEPDLASPFFHPQFVRGLLDIGRDVLVSVQEEDDQIHAMYPFERDGRQGRPAGWPMNDLQAVIGPAGVRWDVDRFMQAAGLTSHRFDHMLRVRGDFEAHVERVVRSPYLDVSGGVDAYRSRLDRTGRRVLSDTKRRLRKATHEVGEIHFEFQSNDPEVLARLFEWKRRQYRETGAVDFLAQSEPRAYLEALVHKNLGRDFAGVLSALWAGTELLSVHLGMRAGGVLHWWFPTFDRRFAEYAPGRLMLLHLAEAAPDVGIDRIDLGKGVADYKQRTMTGAFDVCEGFVETRTLPRVLRRSRLAAAHRVRRTETFRRARSAKRTYQATGSLTAAAREARRKAG